MKIGIVGLPNAGKSTLFNALTRGGAQVGNYPFTTIEPNVAVAPVPDARLAEIARVVGSSEVVPETINFADIAGLVKGASEGEGLGNQFLAAIRESDAICHVVRCHADENVIHPDGSVDPVRDIETSKPSSCSPTSIRRPGASSGWKAGQARRSRGRRRGGMAARGGERARRGAPGEDGAGRAKGHGCTKTAPRADEQADAVRRQRRRG